MSIPNKVRQKVKDRLWRIAGNVGWTTLSASAKSKHYEEWTRDEQVGGVLAHYMDKGQIRVYIKDTLLKDYARQRLANDTGRIFRAVGLTPGLPENETYIKPHGRKLTDGRVICWGRAEDWKLVLLATYERSFDRAGAKAFAAVLVHGTGRFQQDDVRAMIQDAAARLGIEKLCWLDT